VTRLRFRAFHWPNVIALCGGERTNGGRGLDAITVGLPRCGTSHRKGALICLDRRNAEFTC